MLRNQIQTQELTVSANAELAGGIYNIPVRGRSASGKVVASTLPVKVLQASLNSYLVGRFNVADVIVGETDTIFYEENIEAVGIDSIRFTSNVKHDDHYLLYSYAAEVQNSGNNIALEIKWPTGPAREPWVMTTRGSQIISNLDEFVILYGLYFGPTWEYRHAVFRRVK